jgi:hypothetical protein
MLCSLSTLGSSQLSAIHRLEQELGRPVLAFSCHDITPADVTQEELEKIQHLEEKLGLSLVAVKP